MFSALLLLLAVGFGVLRMKVSSVDSGSTEETLRQTPSLEFIPDAPITGTAESSTKPVAGSSQRLPSSPSSQRLLEGEFAALVEAYGKGNTELRNQALNQLQVLARNEQNLPALRDALLALSAEDQAFAPLVAALGAVGTPAVQHMLTELIAARGEEWRVFSAVVPVFGLLEAPTDDSIEFLRKSALHPDPDFSSAAALALGSVVHTLSQTNATRGEALLRDYLSKLEKPWNDEEGIKEALGVLGNAGLVRSAPLILALTEHPSADVRSDALMALRFIRTPESERRMRDKVENDASVDVRMRAVDALIHGPVPDEMFGVVKNLLTRRNKTPAQLREKLLDIFLHAELAEGTRKELSEWMTRLVASEPEGAIRNKASAVVQELQRIR